jgi:hypothetical protein
MEVSMIFYILAGLAGALTATVAMLFFRVASGRDWTSRARRNGSPLAAQSREWRRAIQQRQRLRERALKQVNRKRLRNGRSPRNQYPEYRR